MSTIDILGNRRPSDSFAAPDVAPQFQVRPHHGFASGVVHTNLPRLMRDTDHHTEVLARPEGWSQRDDLPCLNNWPLYDEDYRDDPEAGDRLCFGCPVTSACLASAMRQEGKVGASHRYGVRGGTTPAQRAALMGVPGCTRNARHGADRDAKGECRGCAAERRRRCREAAKSNPCSKDASHGIDRYANGACRQCTKRGVERRRKLAVHG